MTKCTMHATDFYTIRVAKMGSNESQMISSASTAARTDPSFCNDGVDHLTGPLGLSPTSRPETKTTFVPISHTRQSAFWPDFMLHGAYGVREQCGHVARQQ